MLWTSLTPLSSFRLLFRSSNGLVRHTTSPMMSLHPFICCAANNNDFISTLCPPSGTQNGHLYFPYFSMPTAFLFPASLTPSKALPASFSPHVAEHGTRLSPAAGLRHDGSLSIWISILGALSLLGHSSCAVNSRRPRRSTCTLTHTLASTALTLFATLKICHSHGTVSFSLLYVPTRCNDPR